MDIFNKAQHHNLGIGGIKCPCCNNIARKGHDKKDRKLNRIARANVKAEAQREVVEAIAEIEEEISLELFILLV